ncbi:MAG: FIST C-terminal domain-containing protein [Halobacteriovoraceae bacterium]|nr:FIST C-terminal domain-containing protein [Halobacteriovoraceae bacterium]
MSIYFGAGVSKSKNIKEAVRQSVSLAKKNAGIDKVDFAFVYSTVGYDQELLVELLSQELDGAHFSGCSGVGVIGPDFTNEENFAISVLVYSGDELLFENIYFENLHNNDEEIGKNIAIWAEEFSNDAKALFLFPEGLTCNYDALKRGYENTSINILPLFGGLTGDNFLMKKTFQYCNGKSFSNSIVATILKGNVDLLWDVTHGCSPIGEVRTITKCKGNVIFEMDHRPILDVLKEYLTSSDIDNWESAVANICLGFKADEDISKDYDEFIIRFIPAKNDSDGSVTLSSEVQQGQEVWMARRDQERIENGVETMIKSITKKSRGREPLAIFHFDCAGRGKMIMNHEKKENIVRNFQSNIKGENAWSGFYTFGEIAPVNNKNFFHNYTAVILALYKKED